MDVELVQKINRLAMDLINRGVVTSRVDAVKRAEEMLSRDGSLAISSISGAQPMQRTSTMQSTPMGASPQVSQVASQQSEPGLDELKEAILKNNEYFVKTIKEFKATLEALQGELGSVKTELAIVKQKAISMSLSSHPQQTLSERPAQQAGAPRGESSSAPVHPRQGNYNPGDVAIEKMFYMGKK